MPSGFENGTAKGFYAPGFNPSPKFDLPRHIAHKPGKFATYNYVPSLEKHPLAFGTIRQYHKIASRIKNLDFNPFELRYHKTRDKRRNTVYTPISRKPIFGDYRVPFNNRSAAFVKNWRLGTMPRKLARLNKALYENTGLMSHIAKTALRHQKSLPIDHPNRHKLRIA